MIQLKRLLGKIDEQKKVYRILLNRSRFRKDLEDRIWTTAADLTSRFDVENPVASQQILKENKEGLLLAFNAVRRAPKKTLSIPFMVATHAQALEFANPNVIGHLRNMHARWLNSTMVLANPAKVPYLLDQLVDGINMKKVPAFYWDELPDRQFQMQAQHPIMQAIETNYNIVAIHPFSDGNKRAARLISAWVLDKYGHIPLSIYDRNNYISSIEDYFNTRRPHMFYQIMLDQMRQSYDHAICEARSLDGIQTYPPVYPPIRKKMINAKRSLPQQDRK